MAATTSKDFGLRFFYFAFACLLYSIWRAVDLLVQSELTGEYEHSPIVTVPREDSKRPPPQIRYFPNESRGCCLNATK